MKPIHKQLNTEVTVATEERKIKIILVMYIICIIVFSVHNITDIYHASYKIIPIRATMLLFIIISFFAFYKRGEYEKAAYAILLILAIATIAISVVGKFDNYTPAFIFPFILGAFSLFSWKKGLLFSSILLLIILFLIFHYESYFQDSSFLHNRLSIFNFLFILIIIFVFAFYYETTRIHAYEVLINANYKKDILYNEIHHRVKNNLNVVSSMLAIQAEKEDAKIQDILKISKARIDSMAMVHSMLYVSNDLEKVNAKSFIEKLFQNIQSTIDTKVDIVFRAKQLELSLNEVIPIGLIINELLTNSFKYAFIDMHNPKIIIVLKLSKNTVLLTYYDNGIGYDSTCEEHLGLKLVHLNVRQLKGDLKINHRNGLCYKITYKRDSHV